MHCGVAYESIQSIARGHVIRVWNHPGHIGYLRLMHAHIPWVHPPGTSPGHTPGTSPRHIPQVHPQGTSPGYIPQAHPPGTYPRYIPGAHLPGTSQRHIHQQVYKTFYESSALIWGKVIGAFIPVGSISL